MGEVRHFAMIVLAGMDNTLKISPARGESIFAGFVSQGVIKSG